MRHTRRLISLGLLGMILAFSAGCGNNSGLPGGHTREYYIAAVEQDWDYAPQGGGGFGNFTGTEVARTYPAFATKVPNSGTATRIGTVYKKALFRLYSSNGQPLDHTPQWQHLGALGPAIRAEVGDTVKIHFWNQTNHPVNIIPSGLYFSRVDANGNVLQNYTTASTVTNIPVPPQQKQDYSWLVPDRAGPIITTNNTGTPRIVSVQTGTEAASVAWTYRSAVNYRSDANQVSDEDTGLLGPIIIYSRGGLDSAGVLAKGLTNEYVTMYKVYNENNSFLLRSNLVDKASYNAFDAALLYDPGFVASNMKYTINGYMYGNLPMLTLTHKKKTRWYVMGGNGAQSYSPTWVGNNVLVRTPMTNSSSYVNSLSITPDANPIVGDMVPDNKGIWLLQSFDEQFVNGMYGFYRVY